MSHLALGELFLHYHKHTQVYFDTVPHATHCLLPQILI